MAEEVTPADLRMRTSDFVKALAFAMVIVVVTAVTVASLVDEPEPAPVARVTTEDLEAMALLAEAMAADDDRPRAQRRVARQMLDVVEAVEAGEVRIVPDPTAPPPLPTTTPSTTTTTTTSPPPTTAPLGSRGNPAPWPGVTVPSVTVVVGG